ncbi:MAG: tetratricopeptide repeat protein [Gammaproteobacteria bacterium]|nr:tetratricopeptide repeat protein [Gammaproteobacteria bacterium]
MFKLFNFKQKKIDKLFEEADEFSEQGLDDEAIEKYKEVLKIEPYDSSCYYNIGLIYKYRNDWLNSFKYNEIAYEIDPASEGARWNLGIAATALRDWDMARRIWHDAGIEIEEGEGPIDDYFGTNPVRLNPDDEAEVVWAERLDPARAKIISVPLPESGYGAGDIVLNDGAPMGYRMLGDSERAVFNVLELFEASLLNTYRADIKVSSDEDIVLLEKMFAEKDIPCEDWTTQYRLICKACSEGRPHEHHDNETVNKFVAEHEIALAAEYEDEIKTILNNWENGISRVVLDLNCIYSRNES